MLLAGTLLLLAALGPWIAPHDPAAQDLMRALQPPDVRHWLGTDHVGRDVLSRILHGAPRSLGLALFCVVLATGLGVALGLLAVSGGRLVDGVTMRLADLMLAFPGMLLALVLAGFLGGGVIPMLIGLKLTLWPQFARMARATALTTLAEAHVEAAELAGFSRWHVTTRHVLPPVLRVVLPLATLGVGAAILSISALGFLGLGLQPPTPEWGAMISELLAHLDEAPVQMAAPCLMIFLSVLGFTLLGRHLTGTANAGTTNIADARS
jgi:ABC-type dipeptide/oligopeptide/nickel transport system permease subunit